AYGTDECVASFRWLFETLQMNWALEPLATLGDSLALVRQSTWSNVSAENDVPSDSPGQSIEALTGPFEGDTVVLFEVDEREQTERSEVFANDHPGAAIARLYERYAERLPAGAAANRAAATARITRAILADMPDLEVWCAELSPAF